MIWRNYLFARISWMRSWSVGITFSSNQEFCFLHRKLSGLGYTIAKNNEELPFSVNFEFEGKTYTGCASETNLFLWWEDLGKFQVFSPRQALNIMVLFQLMVNMKCIRAMIWYKYILNTRPTLKNDITSFCEIIPTMTRFIGMVTIKSTTKLAKNSLMIKIWWHLEFFMIAKEYIKIKKTSKKIRSFCIFGTDFIFGKNLDF